MPVTPRVRLAAVGTSVIALVLAVKLGTLFATAPYLGLLGTVLLLLAVAATVRVWCLGRFACQAAACVLAVSVATGQLLVASVGLPGAASLDRSVGGWGVLALLAEALVLVTVLTPGIAPKR